MRGPLLALALAGCAGEAVAVRRAPPPVAAQPTVPPPAPRPASAPEEAPKAVVTRFLEAVGAHDFGAALALLAGPLRERYTPERLAQDFEREPLAAERLERIRRALDTPFSIEARQARLTLGESRGLWLVREEAGWRIAALE